MERYFNINYEFDKSEVHRRIEEQLQKNEPNYICVSDGVIVNTAIRHADYLKIINDGMFSICDSSWVPLYIKMIYGKKREQYCGCDIFRDIVSKGKYRMFFMGSKNETLHALQKELEKMNPEVKDMTFYELPFCSVDDFDYQGIADMINKDGADIVWVSLGAPKQERFMYYLRPYLKRSVSIAVGAAFKFFSGLEEKRAPKWMLKNHLEFMYRIYEEPKKQLRRCVLITMTLPKMILKEWKRKKKMDKELKKKQNNYKKKFFK